MPEAPNPAERVHEARRAATAAWRAIHEQARANGEQWIKQNPPKHHKPKEAPK